MKKILSIVFLSIIIACSSNNNRYESEDEMNLNCKNLNGLNDFILNKTTISDIYNDYDVSNIDTSDFYSRNIGNRFQNFYNYISEHIEWKRINIRKYNIDSISTIDIRLEFYMDTLVQIQYGYPTDKINKEQLPAFYTNSVGHGRAVSASFLESLSNGYSTSYTKPLDIRKFRLYKNEDIHMIVEQSFNWYTVVLHKPRLIALFNAIDSAYSNTFLKSYSKKDSNANINKSKGHNSMDADDDEYWKSVNREESLKKAGMKDAAKMERKARQEYLQGGGYSSPEGGSQIRYQGSKEQQEHLEEMKRRGW